MTRPPRLPGDSRAAAPRHDGSARRWSAITAVACLLAPAAARAQTALSDVPPLTTYAVPGNLALTLSVEFPTAVSVAYANRTYAAATQYLGYFDPNKCYTYTSSSTDTTGSPNTSAPATYFTPSAAASAHVCSGQWSGNFLNWASMQTIDTFRWVLTGGYRVIDSSTLSVVEKAWGSGQGGTGNFPDGSIPAAAIAGATPFGSLVAQGVTGMQFRIAGQGNQMRFFLTAPALTYNVLYFNCTNFSCPSITPTPSTVTDFSAIAANQSPAPGVNSSNFGARYTATVTVPQTGTYTFGLMADDGASLYLNGSATPIATATYYNSTALNAPNPGGSVNLNAGDTLSFRLDYYQYYGGAAVQPYWQLPGSSAMTPIGPPGGSLDTGYLDYKGASAAPNTTYNLFVRAKVCDVTSPAGLESNCTAYGSNAKPEGLLQKYNKQLRYSTFSYLNDNNSYRDGGVLRAKQGFVGPYQPVYASADIVNPAAEWDASTGVFVRNPDSGDASTTGVSDSGTLNYINKFGEITKQGYKTYDPVSELYYAAIRYFRNLGNVHEWSDGANTTMIDGFPVITTWADPILYSCQKNFVLGIGDVHTWYDKDVPGNTNTNGEPNPMPSGVSSDTTSNAVTATQQVGKIEGYSSALQNAMIGNPSPWGTCCGGNSALMAGIAYDAHTSDIRPDLTPKAKIMTVDTYWVDVQEGQSYVPSNQFYLATKYGGFTVPAGFKPYDPAATLTDASWWNGTSKDPASGQKLPNNYFSGGQPDLMQSGLTSAFAAIAAAAGAHPSTSFIAPLPQIGTAGTPSYSTQYDASTWAGYLYGSFTTLSATGAPSAVAGGEFGQNLTTRAPATRSIATWSAGGTGAARGAQFEAAVSSTITTALSTSQLAALDTSVVPGNDSANFLAYLRGDRSMERLATSTASDPTRPYRTRASLLGDIVDSKPTAVGVPSFPYSDASNPGYNAFKTGSPQASRPTVVYVGANDGMLHAVNGNLATSTATSDGNELFAYVPNALFQGPNGTPNVDGLASLGNPAFVHHYMVDATAFNFDVDFNRTSDGTAAPPTTWTPDWHTVLIGGLGKGGKAYYALDVTDPASMTNEVTLASKVLWEVTQPSYLGYTYGEPAVMKTKKYGWVVVLPSGYNNADGVGHLLFVNPKTGKLLETVTMPAGSSGVAHVNSYLIDGTDGTADALYAGDLQGNLWRVDVTGAFGAAYPAPLLLARLTDSSTSAAGQPVTTRPQIAVDPLTGRRFVLVGTGRLLDSSDIGPTMSSTAGQVQSFYAIIDGTNGAFNATAATGTGFPITRSQLADDTTQLTSSASTAALTVAGWVIDLVNPPSQPGPASRVIIDSSTSSGNVAFGTVEPNGSACNPGGSGAVYGLHFGTARSIVINSAGTLSYLSTAPDNSPLPPVTETKFVSNNGSLTLLYGCNGAACQANIQANSGNVARRVNWREVPTAD